MMIETELYPYAGLPGHQNWRSAVSAIEDRRMIDPQGPVKFRLERSARVASGGSCFAQRLADGMREFGLDYVVLEPGGEPYSARYGNIYTSRQLVQLIERALGRFRPLDAAWPAPGGFVDPFRPRAARSFASADELEADRRAHLDAVREMFAGVDLFVFTLGQTEVWIDRRDGAAFPVCPGRGLGVFDPARHVFRNLDAEAVKADLERFIAIFREINPAGKLILSVSPVPMAATMTPLHVVRASTYSKSVLKVAAEEVAARHAHVDYFAAYDFVTQNLGGGRLFRDGERHPTAETADSLVRLFVEDYFGAADACEAPAPAERAALMLARTNAPPCDEDVLIELIVADDRQRAPRTEPLRPVRGDGNVEVAAHPIPMYFAGDSNCLIFKDRVFSVPGSRSPFLGRALHTPGLAANDFCDAGGNLNHELLSRLVGEHLLMRDDGGGWMAYRRVGNAALDFVEESEGRERPDPPIVLFCGIIDWLRFFEEIAAREIALPAGVMQSDAYASGPGALDFETAAAGAARYLEPLERGLRVLRSYGLRNVHLHCVQPPTPDDVVFAQAFFASTARARYQSVGLMNHLLRGVCERTGTTFIDLWPRITGGDGYVDARYHFDAFHLNLDAALLTVEAVLNTSAEHTLAKQAADERSPRAGYAAEAQSSAADDIADSSAVRFGSGWYPAECDADMTIRWARAGAMLYVPVFAAVEHRVSLEVEPGPGVGSKPFTLEVYDAADELVASSEVRGRQMLELTLPPAAPRMHALRFHLADGGRRIAGDDRSLDFRAFLAAVTPQRADVFASGSGLRAGAGWYALEDYRGSTFRWANNDAVIHVSSPAAELVLDIEPGPGVGRQPFVLHATDVRGGAFASVPVSTRQNVVVPLPGDEPTPYVIKLRAEGGGRATLGDSRTLNFRVFRSA